MALRLALANSMDSSPARSLNQTNAPDTSPKLHDDQAMTAHNSIRTISASQRTIAGLIRPVSTKSGDFHGSAATRLRRADIEFDLALCFPQLNALDNSAPVYGQQYLCLKLETPPRFLKAISEGTDPSPADKSTIDAQIKNKQIKVYVFNSQNSTPDVTAQVNAAKKAGVPVSTVTETLSPAGASFQGWQSAQLHSLEKAVHQATGKGFHL